jgi:predicted nucleic acid-binding protein
MAEVSRRLEERLGPDEEAGIAAITASELLHGVHRATPEHRARREAFVEAVLTAFPPLPRSRITEPNLRPASASGMARAPRRFGAAVA